MTSFEVMGGEGKPGKRGRGQHESKRERCWRLVALGSEKMQNFKALPRVRHMSRRTGLLPPGTRLCKSQIVSKPPVVGQDNYLTICPKFLFPNISKSDSSSQRIPLLITRDSLRAIHSPRHLTSLQRAVGVQQHLGVSVNTSVKLVVSFNSTVEAHFVRNHKAGLGSSCNDQVPQVAVVGLDIALSCSEMETLCSSRESAKTVLIWWCQSAQPPSQIRLLTFSNSLPNEIRIWPLALWLSGAPGSCASSVGYLTP